MSKAQINKTLNLWRDLAINTPNFEDLESIEDLSDSIKFSFFSDVIQENKLEQEDLNEIVEDFKIAINLYNLIENKKFRDYTVKIMSELMINCEFYECNEETYKTLKYNEIAHGYIFTVDKIIGLSIEAREIMIKTFFHELAHYRFEEIECELRDMAEDISDEYYELVHLEIESTFDEYADQMFEIYQKHKNQLIKSYSIEL